MGVIYYGCGRRRRSMSCGMAGAISLVVGFSVTASVSRRRRTSGRTNNMTVFLYRTGNGSLRVYYCSRREDGHKGSGGGGGHGPSRSVHDP